jgi:hypothetical protein
LDISGMVVIRNLFRFFSSLIQKLYKFLLLFLGLLLWDPPFRNTA